MRFVHELRKILWKTGIDVSPFNPSLNPIARKKKLFEEFRINVVFDVGANTGQFATEIRNDIRFRGRLFSFEPVHSAFMAVNKKAADDPLWKVFNYALGEKPSSGKIFISGNSQSSSLLEMLPSQLSAAPGSTYISEQSVSIQTLDTVVDELCFADDSIYLKIDTQGYESKVLQGAEKCMKRINTIQLEMPLVHLYNGEMLFSEMHFLLTSKGYSLVSIEPGFSDYKTGRLLEIDGIYHRY